MAFKIEDVSLENFLKKITFASDTSPGSKLQIPNGEFVHALLFLKIEDSLERIRSAMK